MIVNVWVLIGCVALLFVCSIVLAFRIEWIRDELRTEIIHKLSSHENWFHIHSTEQYEIKRLEQKINDLNKPLKNKIIESVCEWLLEHRIKT